jgi:sugar O-acyltransferase (sialic acid O-acetyltransferase NeuD family)
MIYLYGAGGHAKVIIEILEKKNIFISGLIDVNPDIKKVLGYPVSEVLSDTLSLNGEVEIIIAIGNNVVRKKIAEKTNHMFATAIHTSANISVNALIGKGSVIMAGVTANSGVVVGSHNILNSNCCIDHDCILEDYVHISPNAALAGNVTVGEGTHVGIGACIIPGIKIGKWAIIGAGTVVIKDIPDYAVVVGNPGKVIKYNYPYKG